MVNDKLPQFPHPKDKKGEKKLFSSVPVGQGSQLLNEQSLSQFTKNNSILQSFFSCQITAAHYSGEEPTITEPWCTTGHIRLPPQNICHMVPQLNRRVTEKQ